MIKPWREPVSLDSEGEEGSIAFGIDDGAAVEGESC